jgi:hypothetical protein
MATSPQALSRLQLQTMATAVFTALSLDTSRIKLGLANIADNVELLGTLVSAGPYLMIRPATTARISSTEKIMPYVVECQLYYGAAQNSDFDFTAVEDLVYGPTGLVTKFLDFTAYGTTAPAIHVSAAGPDVRSDLNPMAISYSIEVQFLGAN